MRIAILPFLVSALAAASSGAASELVTPALQPSATGELACWVVNTSKSKTLEIEVEIRSFTGAVAQSGGGTVDPGAANGLATDDDQARFCVVRVIRGGKKNARVSLLAREAGATVAAVQAGR